MTRREATRRAVTGVVQRLAAARLGRAFLPLGALCLLGVAELVTAATGGRGWMLLGGGVASAVGLLAYGNTAVLRALGRGDSPRGRAGQLAGLVSYLYALWVVGDPGLRSLAAAGGGGAQALALAYFALGALHLWQISRLSELLRLAGTMAVPAPGEERTA